MGERPSTVGRLHRALLLGSAGIVLAGTGVVAAASAAPTPHRLYQPVDTGGTFLPTSGPQRTVIIGPEFLV